MTRVLVLGTNGMLGGMISRVFAASESITAVPSNRRGEHGALAFDAIGDSIADLLENARCQWIVNAIGMLADRIIESDPDSVAAAMAINGTFPKKLAEEAGRDRRVINIATDGVYSGTRAPYDELAHKDATGAYAVSKAAGEILSPSVVNLRCSVIGPERGSARSLLGWALSQPQGAIIPGYSNHCWNGITSYHFARICEAVILSEGEYFPPIAHVVPDDSTTKAELLRMILAEFGRGDVSVEAEPALVAVDRTLSTVHPDLNRWLWAAAGYSHPPTIGEMVAELAAFGRE